MMTTADRDRLIAIETTVNDLKRELLGNGQPGKIALHGSRISKLENWRSYVTGSLVVIAAVLTAVGTIGGILLAAALKR